MRGYWHIAALSVVISTLTIIYSHYWFIFGYFLWLFYLFYDERLGKIPLLVSLTFFFFFSFYIPTVEKTGDTANFNLNESQTFTGKIIRPPVINDKKIEFLLREQTSQQKYLIIFFPSAEIPLSTQKIYTQLKYGASCKVSGKVDWPNESRNPGQFDFRDYLLKQGIKYQMIIGSLEEIYCEGASPFHIIYTIRMNLMNKVTQKLNPETAAWLNALVLGNDSLLDQEISELFQKWGLSHILAISGLHVGLIISLVYFLIVKLNLVTKETAQWIMIFFLPLYAVIAGGQPSVWRASIMALLFILFNRTKLKFNVTDTLSIVFLLLILFDKYIVYHVGFQLSFTVTFGLVISRHLLSKTSSAFYQMLLISFISQMMILPLQLTYFSAFQPLSIMLNLVVVPYFSLFVIPLMFILLIVYPLPNIFLIIVQTPFIYIHEWFLSAIHWLDRTASFPIFIGEFPVILMIVYYGLFYIFMKSLQKKEQLEAFKYGLLVVMLLIFTAIRPYFSPAGTVTMLDIGQGDAFIIELPYRKGVFFIDAGANFSFTDFQPTDKVYKQVIKPYLYSRGITRIDAIFLSHEDIDHMGSVPYMIEDMKVNEVVISNYYELHNDDMLLWEDQGVTIRRLGPNENITIKGQNFQGLGLASDQHSSNENSLVLYTELGGKRWLFTGDIGKETEKKLMGIYDQLSIDVLKVGHHGSKTSTDPSFIQMIDPDFALVSVGVTNSYGHPAAEVIETLSNENVQILRTDESGAVQFKFKNNHGTFSRYLP